MESHLLQVPKGIRYVGDWPGFKLEDFPHIIDKKIPGCGFTEYCITNLENIVLCSPRRILLENKTEQHRDDVFYVINDYEKVVGIDKDINKCQTKKNNKSNDTVNVSQDQKNEYYKKLKEDLFQYTQRRFSELKPCKILVTYDSFHLVKSVLNDKGLDMLSSFRIIVDEFQSIFVDSKFKSSTENGFLYQLRDLQKVCYVSATPMMKSYMEMLDDFKNLPYYEFDWSSLDPNRIMKPQLKIRTSKSVFTSAKEIIDSYKKEDFKTHYRKRDDGSIEMVESKEAVIYVNSVNNILSIINKAELKPEECNILCANTTDNQNKIKTKLGKGFSIGKVPLKGEKHKMFTFCTRTVYLGADFYSTNARTFIISDANISTLSVDISLDLPQILGRQRLNENPWKNEAEFYYKPISNGKVITQEDFKKELESKITETNNLLSAYVRSTEAEQRSMAKKYLKDVVSSNYKDDYVAVNYENGELVPVFNQLVLISEQRAFEIQQVDYADRFSVFNQVGISVGLELEETATKYFLREYENLPTLYAKLKFLVKMDEDELLLPTIIDQLTEKHFKEYFTILGVSKIRALGFDVSRLEKALKNTVFDITDLIEELTFRYPVGTIVFISELKDTLRELYDKFGYNRVAKATDIEEWFEIRQVMRKDSLGKKSRAYEIIKKK